MIRIIVLVLIFKSIQGFGVTSVDDTTTTTTSSSTTTSSTTSTTTGSTTTSTTTSTTKGDDGSVAGVDQCFANGGNCASCCGACDETTDLDNRGKGSCVCYEASAAPLGRFYGTINNDCVFIEAYLVTYIIVRNQCLEGARRKCSPRREEEVDTQDASRACGRDSDLISPTS